MLRWIVFIARPFGVSLGLFILVNLALALQEPRLSANQTWLSVPIDEPWLSFYAALLGVALLVPHRSSSRPWLRRLQCGIFVGFLVLAVCNAFGFYHRLGQGRLQSGALFPLSLVLAVILGLETVRALTWKAASFPVPRPARRFFGAILVAVACFAMILVHIYTYGMTDYRDVYAEQARGPRAAVVLGARVYPDGRLSDALADRLETGLRLYEERRVDYLILSGGIEPDGLSEPRAMAAVALARKVPLEALILDEAGATTHASAINCSAIAARLGFDSLIVVSQYFHNARVKLVFERAGVPCYTVPAVPERQFRREVYFLFREAVAFPYYLLFQHGG